MASKIGIRDLKNRTSEIVKEVRESGADGASGGQDGTNTLAAVPQDVQVSDEVVESLVVHDGSPVNVGSKDGQCREGSLSLRVTGRVGSMQLK